MIFFAFFALRTLRTLPLKTLSMNMATAPQAQK